jgi:hypothetical protein
MSSDHIYTEEELVELLERASQLGLSLGPDSDLEKLTVAELERLVNYKC